jgi:glyoxylase-like metal-dependent hydrolase (beta-lactamase superfamily II)
MNQGTRVVDVEQVADNLFVLRGGGGNTALFVTADGVTVVDTKSPGWGRSIIDTIRELTPKPVTRIINTHTHSDHVGGNVEFPAGVEVVVQDHTSAHMQKMDIFTQHEGRGLPTTTFTDTMGIGKGADRIDLYYFGPGHTNGDAIVVFPALGIAHIGDLFFNRGLLAVARREGGRFLSFADTVDSVHRGIEHVDTIINGHTPKNTTWNDLKTFAEFNRDFLSWGQAQLAAGKSPTEAAAAWTLPATYEANGYPSAAQASFSGLEYRLQMLQKEMGQTQFAS